MFNLVKFSALLVVLVGESWSLESSDTGACVVRLSSMKMKRISYSITLMKNGRRHAYRRYRNQSYQTWTNHTVCCQGWQHDSSLDICSPVCSTGCVNGTCIAPSTCHCEPPLYVDPERFNSCLSPECDPPCVNSICNKNNICECDANTKRYNKTHCAHCKENFSINPDLTCTPICKNPCTNGECIAPNTCSCLQGFQDNGIHCEPLCERCVNSTCIAPNVCSCFEGFTAVDETTCTPKCDDCDNGVCVAPGQCECSKGYTKLNGSCEPDCAECVNGFCAAPGQCSCIDGYVERSRNLCAKPCRPECNGTCDLEGFCSVGVCRTSTKFVEMTNIS